MYKRLLTLKNLIEAKDFHEIELQINYLSEHEKFDSLKNIIDHIRSCSYPEAISLIDNILSQHKALQKTPDSDITGMRTVENLYKVQLSVLVYKKAELRRIINTFRVRHNQEVGEIIGKILHLRKEILLKQYIENPEFENDYKEANADYEKFYEAFSKAVKDSIPKISEDEKKTLQKAFRKASKICHPDVVAEEFKEEANKIFIELQRAYFFNNIERVVEILDMLEKNEILFISKTGKVTERELLAARIKKLETDISQLKEEIENLESSSVYQTIKDIKDWDLYFSQLKEKFLKELEQLQK